MLCGDERRLPDLWAAGHPGGGQGPEPGGHPAGGQKQSWLAWGLSALLPLIIFLALSWRQASKSAAHAVSLLAAAVAMLALNLAAGKLNRKWLKEWAMALSVLCGILAGALTGALL